MVVALLVKIKLKLGNNSVLKVLTALMLKLNEAFLNIKEKEGI